MPGGHIYTLSSLLACCVSATRIWRNQCCMAITDMTAHLVCPMTHVAMRRKICDCVAHCTIVNCRTWMNDRHRSVAIRSLPAAFKPMSEWIHRYAVKQPQEVLCAIKACAPDQIPRRKSQAVKNNAKSPSSRSVVVGGYRGISRLGLVFWGYVRCEEDNVSYM